ncbi:MAG: alpha/beta hydrolase, partial [Deltaproteobacteria bacterium]|nr:alpha/beta hydrolase [Deltaproteobacteria bacterium]
FLAGHSFGGQVLLNFLAEYPGRFQAACAASPNLEIALTMPKWQERLGRMVLPVWPQMKLKNLTDPSKLSHDPRVFAEYKNDPLISDYVTLGIGKVLLENLGSIFEKARRIQTPLLMLHGLEDVYCSPKGTERFYNQLQLEEKRLKLYEGKYHELLNETGKEEIYAEMEQWFDRFMPA